MPRPSRILIVDNEPLNVKLLEAQLAAQGHEVVTAASGAEALRLATEQPVDLILLDVIMPGMDGFEVTARLRAQESTRLIPIVLITALKETADRIKGIEAGCDDFISKPFDKHEVLARVKTLLRLNYYRSLLDEKDKFEFVIDHLEDGIVVLDRHLQVRRVNRRAADLLSLNPAHPPLDVLGHLTRTLTVHYEGDLRHAFLAQAVTCDLERPETPTARPLILAVRSSVVRDPSGAISSVVLLVRDVTEERREERLQRNFLSVISHKLHTPIAVITMQTSLLREEVCGPLTDQQREGLTTILETAYKLGGLIDRLLEFTTLHAQALQPVGEPLVLSRHLPALLERLVKRAPNTRVDCRLDCPEADLAAGVNPVYFDLIMTSLIENAIKFNDKDVTQITVRVARRNGRIECAVTDNGPGIPPEEHERIFRRFYQVEKDFTGNVAGAGLGLALVRRLITAYGGMIQVRSELGCGATFTFTLPGVSRATT